MCDTYEKWISILDIIYERFKNYKYRFTLYPFPPKISISQVLLNQSLEFPHQKSIALMKTNFSIRLLRINFFSLLKNCESNQIKKI